MLILQIQDKTQKFCKSELNIAISMLNGYLQEWRSCFSRKMQINPQNPQNSQDPQAFNKAKDWALVHERELSVF